MPVNSQRPFVPASMSPRNHSKYTNKDGSKFITVPKGTASDSSQPTTPTNTNPTRNTAPALLNDVVTAPVNRKKQKRRQKAAAKAAAEQALGDFHSQYSVQDDQNADGQDAATESDDEHEYVLAEELTTLPVDDDESLRTATSFRKNKKKKKHSDVSEHLGPLSRRSEAGVTSGPATAQNRSAGISKDKIWSTSNHEERERIKEFWLGLGEDERKSLVKVEKDAVLKKMKEQQKHTCSCTVCGRKRTAIEEELEGLYDAYYLELEQFANHAEGPPTLPPQREFPARPPPGPPAPFPGHHPSRGRIVEHVGDDEDDDELEEVYSDDDIEDDDYSDDEPPEEFHGSHERDVADFLTFGNSLQVKGTQLLDVLLGKYGNMDLGGILTVADDLLKNDGKRFIEMMEQLAERRMAREEDAREHFSRGYGHPNGSYSNPHNHLPPEEDDYEEDEDEEDDYDDSQEEEYEDEEVYSSPSLMPSKSHTECCCQDQMTEEQRMEEGRRMFQIFAARMFEQRVLSAYKEKIAKERQQKLLEELDEESRQVDEQKAKRAKTAQKKKDKAAQKKQVQAEDKARREAEKAAETAARLLAEQRRAEEQKQKAEEKRRQKEAQKKAEEEARMKKEADRHRRLHEQREKQAEQERKVREAKEREKKLREEQRQKDKELREQRERDAQERKDKHDRDKREKEARAARALKDAQEAKEAKEKAKESTATFKAAPTAPQAIPLHVAKRAHLPPATTSTIIPQQPSNSAPTVSPKVPIVTPVLAKASASARRRTLSQQRDAVESTPPPAIHPPLPFGQIPTSPRDKAGNASSTGLQETPSPHQTTQRVLLNSNGGINFPINHAVSPITSHVHIQNQPATFQGPPIPIQPPPGLSHHHPPPGFQHRNPHESMYPPGFRPEATMMMPPPGMGAPAGQGFPPMPMPPPGFSPVNSGPFAMRHGFPMPKEHPPPAHARRTSSGYENHPLAVALPIGRPAPIGRPGSMAYGQVRDDEDDTQHLGSRVLVEDDEPLPTDSQSGSLPGHLRMKPPAPRGFGTSPFMENSFPIGHSPWGPSVGGSHPLPPPGFGNQGWGPTATPPGFNVGSPATSLGSMRAPSQPRHVTVRLMLCQACRALASTRSASANGFVDIHSIKSQVDTLSGGDPAIMEEDLLNLCDTEGSPSNGGGTFEVHRDAGGSGNHWIKWLPEQHDGMYHSAQKAVGAPGEIGSPLARAASLRGG